MQIFAAFVRFEVISVISMFFIEHKALRESIIYFDSFHICTMIQVFELFFICFGRERGIRC